jgi:hypothetical protein
MSKRICSISDCGRRHKGRGYCEAHLDRLKRHGDPLHGGPVVTKGTHMTCTVDGCDNPHKGHGYCVKHVQKWRRYGDPLAGREDYWAPHQFAQWLLEQPDTPDCIEPPGFKSRPLMILDGTMHNASRAAWILHHDDPGKQYVLHTCDNEMCVNVQHLYLGDQRRNNLDAIERGRRPKTHPVHGERHPSAKLTASDVRDARDSYARGTSLTELGRRFGVSEPAMRCAVLGVTWKSV